MEDDVASADPPNQGVARVAVAGHVPLWAVQVDADVGSVGDLQPEPLPRIAGPPRVDLACFVQPVLGHGVGEANPVRRSLNKYRSGQLQQDGADEGAPVTERGDTDLDFAVLGQTSNAVLDPFDRHRLTAWGSAGAHQHFVAVEAEHSIRPAGDGRDLLADERLKELAGVDASSHGPIIGEHSAGRPPHSTADGRWLATLARTATRWSAGCGSPPAQGASGMVAGSYRVCRDSSSTLTVLLMRRSGDSI